MVCKARYHRGNPEEIISRKQRFGIPARCEDYQNVKGQNLVPQKLLREGPAGKTGRGQPRNRWMDEVKSDLKDWKQMQ